MKKFQFSVFALMMAFVSICFTSCKDEEKEDSIVGIWTGAPITVPGVTSTSVSITCEFKNDGTIIWNGGTASTETGTYIFSSRKDPVDKSTRGTLVVTWNTGKTEEMSIVGLTSATMSITRGATMYFLGRQSSGSNIDTSEVTAIVGTWYGDHSASYFVDWTFNGDGTGEQYVRDGDVGSSYKFKYSITKYDASTRSGHIIITYTSGKWSGETDERDFKISESGKAIELGSGYYTK